MFKIEKGKPFYFSLNTLIYTFNIPKKSEHIHFAFFWFIYSIIKFVSILIGIVSPCIHAVLSIKNEIGIDVNEDIAVMIGNVGGIMLCILFTQKYNKWMDFLSEVTFFKGVGDVSIILEKHYKRCNLIITLYYGFCLSGISIWAMMHINQYTVCEQLNQEKGLHEICGTIQAIWLPVNNVSTIQLILIIAIQVLGAICILPSGAMVICLLWESTELLRVHINMLKEDIKHLFDEPGEISDRVHFCIDYHIRILSMASRLNILSKYTLSELAVTGAISMGVIMNQMLTSTIGLLTCSLFLMGYVTGIFLMCYSGELIKNETLSIADAIWASCWDKADHKTIKDLAFMLFRSQKPIYFEALPVGILDYPLFVAILKTSYTYLTMLNQTM